MPLAPYSCRRDKQPSSYAYAAEVVGREQRRILECSLENYPKGDRVGCEERRRRGCQTGYEAQDSENDIALPERPVLPSTSIPLHPAGRGRNKPKDHWGRPKAEAPE